MKELRYDYNDPMRLYCNNRTAINIAHNSVQQDRTKYIEIDKHFIKEKLHARLICTTYFFDKL